MEEVTVSNMCEIAALIEVLKKGILREQEVSIPQELQRKSLKATSCLYLLAMLERLTSNGPNFPTYACRVCPNYSAIAPQNQVSFSSPIEAEAAEYRSAANCP